MHFKLLRIPTFLIASFFFTMALQAHEGVISEETAHFPKLTAVILPIQKAIFPDGTIDWEKRATS